MSDLAQRERQRRLALEPGDADLVSAEARAQDRNGTGRLSWLRTYVGRWCYVEGARMNYLIKLLAVTGTPAGDPAELVSHPVYRVGDWTHEGPQEQYTMRMGSTPEHPRWLPWQAVDDFGLMPEGWDEPAS